MDNTNNQYPPFRIGVVARFKPVHLGHAAMLRALSDAADNVSIGIGSSNRYNARNPFTAGETAEMIRRVLRGRENFRLLEIPDLDDGPKWKVMVHQLFGPLDLFVSANPYVAELLSAFYRVVHPVRMIEPAERVAVDGTMVRCAMARGEEWKQLVPEETAAFLNERGLVERFRREFGLATLAVELEAPSIAKEENHVQLG